MIHSPSQFGNLTAAFASLLRLQILTPSKGAGCLDLNSQAMLQSVSILRVCGLTKPAQLAPPTQPGMSWMQITVLLEQRE